MTRERRKGMPKVARPPPPPRRRESGLFATKENWGLGFWEKKGLRGDGRRDMVLRNPRKRPE